MPSEPQHHLITALRASLQEARQRTLELVADLSDEQMIGPRFDIVNPLRWEIAHLAWFQEYWVVRHFRGEPPTWPEADRLYDSARIPHDTRWDLPLPSKDATLQYVQRVLERVIEPAAKTPPVSSENGGHGEAYFLWLALMHEYMHAEAVTYTRQTLAYPAPQMRISALSGGPPPAESGAEAADPDVLGDAEIPGGEFMLGSPREAPLVFDNEQWAHPVVLEPFRVARAAVTNAQFTAFVEDGGYRRRDFWTDEGWRWREGAGADHPVYWQREPGGRWLRRNFDAWISLEGRHPALHVNWYEADAFCRWAGRRLPTEAEWEMAASAGPSSARSGNGQGKYLFPWGDQPPN
ncbi:MAG: SUMF1/EgtB/PvdO family nonheme iron enzyme, partial [Terriglobia bacterium]